MADELFVEAGPRDYLWIQPIWKDSPSMSNVRSAYAVVVNADIVEGADAIPTWIPLGFHRIIGKWPD